MDRAFEQQFFLRVVHFTVFGAKTLKAFGSSQKLCFFPIDALVAVDASLPVPKEPT